MNSVLKLKIGGFVIALISERDQGNSEFNERYQKFVSSEEEQILIRVNHGQLPSFNDWKLIFNSGGLWRYYQKNNRWGVNVYFSANDAELSCSVIFEHDFYQGDIFIPDNHLDNKFVYNYPLPELHMINLLARGYGVLVHACVVKDGENGLLFAGTSGSGKSTIAEIWNGEKYATVLCDDRAIIRKQDGQFFLYGTPWHGMAGLSSPGAVPLNKIYILKKDEQNNFVDLKPVDTINKLLVRSFPTYWNADGMDFTLSFLEQLVQEIPCYDLGFVPDGSVVDFVRCQNTA